MSTAKEISDKSERETPGVGTAKEIVDDGRTPDVFSAKEPVIEEPTKNVRTADEPLERPTENVKTADEPANEVLSHLHQRSLSRSRRTT